MSVKLMSLAFDVQGVTEHEGFVLVALADHANDEGRSCYPSRERLLHKTKMSASTLNRALAGLRDKELISPEGKTNLNVVEWQIDMVTVTMMAVEYQSERPYPIVTETITHGQSDHETTSNHQEPPATEMEEPTYVPDNGDGVPFEHIMVYHDILGVWAKKFSGKRQPKPTNVKLQKKVKARLKQPDFKERLWAALLYAETSPSLQNDSWFQLEYLLRNDDNYEKVASGEFDWKDSQNKRQPEQVSKPQGNADPNRRLPPRPTEE